MKRATLLLKPPLALDVLFLICCSNLMVLQELYEGVMIRIVFKQFNGDVFLILEFNKRLVMTIKADKNKNAKIALTIILIAIVTIAFVLTSFLSQSNMELNAQITTNQEPKQRPLPIRGTATNETNSLNEVNSNYNYSSASLNTDPISLDTLKSTTYKPPDLPRIFFALPYSPYTSLTTDPISLDASKFNTYTYGGYSVKQPDSTQFIFSFPDSTSQGKIAGSDALTWDTFTIQKIDFDVTFIAPKISALGFDEMVVFATSNTNTFKGTEFGIRMDLKNGFIYGYVQEPNGNYEEVNFMMLELTPNDGVMHHYTVIIVGSEVSFYVDGIDYGYLNFPSNTDYSNLAFSILAVVHRFTDDWDSIGNNMIVENFSLNQQ